MLVARKHFFLLLRIPEKNGLAAIVSRVARDARAQFANATQTYWVCPITQECFPADDRVAIEKHQARVLAQMESKERSKQKAARLKELQKEFAAAESLDAVRAWALRKIQLEVATFSVESLPGMAVYIPAEVFPTDMDVYIRVQGVDILPRPKGRGFLLDGDVPPREC